jgi:hypothetical protein
MTSPHRSINLNLTGKGWSIDHNTASKNTKLKYKTNLGDSKNSLTISQLIPNNKWSMIPTPCYQVTVPGLLGHPSNKLQTTWDTLTRRGKIEKRLYRGDDRRHKAAVEWDTQSGTKITLRTKMDKGMFHSVSATMMYPSKKFPIFSKTVLPPAGMVSLKSKLPDGTKVKTTLVPAAKLLSFSANYKHKDSNSHGNGGNGIMDHLRWEAVSITMCTDIPLHGGHKGRVPLVRVGLKFDL